MQFVVSIMWKESNITFPVTSVQKKVVGNKFGQQALVNKYQVTSIKLQILGNRYRVRGIRQRLSENMYREASIRSDASGLTSVRKQIAGENAW